MNRSRIGLAFTGAHDSIETYVEGASYAEDKGYESVWLAEDYFFRDTVTMATAVATRTDRLDVGLFVNPYTRSPALTAMTATSLSEIAGGDVRIAMGAGPRIVMERFVDYESPLWTVKRAVDLIRDLLAEEEVSFDEPPFEYEEVALGECPYLSYLGAYENPQPEIPIYVAALGPQMLKMAGDVGDGFLVSIGFSPEMVERSLDRVREGLAMRDRDHDSYDVAAFLFCSESLTDRARRFTARTIASRDIDDLEASGLDAEAIAPIQEAYETDGADAAAGYVTDEMVEAFVVTGDGTIPPERQLDRYADVGVDVPILLPLDHGDPESVIDIGAAWADNGA